MTFAHFVKNLLVSYQTFFRLLWRTFAGSRNTRARLTLRRFFMMAGFFPVLFIVQTLHWLGFLADEVFFRGYRSVKIRAPVFIVGVPRSGTTFLHRLLARDEDRFTTFLLWELILAPSVSERKIWLGLGCLDRLMGAPFARLIRWLERRAFADLGDIHEISLSDEEEDYFLLVPIYACFLMILPFPFPDEFGHLAFFDDQIPRADQDRIMDFYRSCIQRHLYVKGTDRPFLSKNVAFSPMIRALARTFPDSRIIGTVRNPVNAVGSHISSMMAGAAVFGNNTRGNEFRNQMIAVQRYAYTHILETLSGNGDRASGIVCMEDLQDNLASTIRGLYKRLGYPMTSGFEAYIEAQDKRQKHYKSGHHYDLAAWGLSGKMIYEQFFDIFERFGYPEPERDAQNTDQAGLMPDLFPDQPGTGPTGKNAAGGLRVLVFSDAIASRNGVGSYYADLVEHLNDHVAHAGLVSPEPGGGDFTHELTFPLPGDPTQRIYLPRAGRVWERVKRVSPHVIVVPTPGPYGLLGLAMACYLKIPLCAGFHTRYEKLTGLYWTAVFRGVSRIAIKCLNRLFFRSSVCVVANSREMIQEAQRQGAIRAEMIGTPIARAFLGQPFWAPESELSSVCYAGRLAPEKNIRAVLDAAGQLPHIRFTIAGDGPLRNEVAVKAESTSNIDYVGWVSRREVKTFIDGSEMLILPSREEAFGTIALEAMARRRLVLVSEKCGILNWSNLALGVYSIKNTESLADAIKRVSEKSFPERLEKAELGYQAAVSFNRDTVCHWVGLLSDIADHGRQ